MTRYTTEFKKEALKLSDEVGLKKAASQLGLPYYTLADWRHRTREKITGEKSQESKPAMKGEEAEQRVRELERENAELRSANEILKDALSFFVRDRKK